MEFASNEDREIRAARNQALFRAVNEKIRQLNESFGEVVGSYAITCECSRLDCVEIVEIPEDAYRAVRENPRTFVVLPEHVEHDVERVISPHGGYTVVEVLGQGARVVEATFRGGREAATRADLASGSS